MTWVLSALAVVVVLYLLAELKTSRPDGTLIQVHPYRRALSFIMPTRNESVFYYEDEIDAGPFLEYLDALKESGRFEARLTHMIVAGLDRGIYKYPTLNRFIAGQRLYQRKGRWFSFAVKRVKKNKQAKLASVKMEMNDGQTFEELCGRINKHIYRERSEEQTELDKELALLNLLPRPMFRYGYRLARILDYYNLLPASFIKGDAMFASVFMANLGTIDMNAGFHHLFEWGTNSIFVVVGQVVEKVVVVDGEMVIQKRLPLRFTMDERADDGMGAMLGTEVLKETLLNPREILGGLTDDYNPPLTPAKG